MTIHGVRVSPIDTFDEDWDYDPDTVVPRAMTDEEIKGFDIRSSAEEDDRDIPDTAPLTDGVLISEGDHAVQCPSRLILTNFVPKDAPYSVSKSPVDRVGDVEDADGVKIGVLISIVTPLRLRQYVKMIGRGPNDARLRCLQWMQDVRGIAMDAVVASFGHSFGFYGEPIVLPGHRNESNLVWSTPTGGVIVCVGNTGKSCGFCLGCKSIEDAKYDVHEKCVYFIRSVDGGPVKIGTSVNPEGRLNALQTAHPTRLKIIGTMKGGLVVEKAIHTLFVADRLRHNGEWFHPSAALIDFISDIGGGSDA